MGSRRAEEEEVGTGTGRDVCGLVARVAEARPRAGAEAGFSGRKGVGREGGIGFGAGTGGGFSFTISFADVTISFQIALDCSCSSST